MRSCHRPRAGRSAAPKRRGAVTVEFALVAPVFVTIILGVYQASQLFETYNLLSQAAREGARLGAMDRSQVIPAGMTTNQKMKQDIENFLESSGIDVEDLEVSVTHHDDPTREFDFNDPANELELFRVKVKLPYNSVSGARSPDDSEYYLEAGVVFRNVESSIVQ